MKTLFLLRHAKSSWKDESIPDVQRPLNSRGRKGSETISEILKQKKVTPDLILSSTAVRARETLDIILRLAKLRGEVRYDERVYEATVDRLLEVVTQIEKGVQSAMIVGHNPGLENLLTALTKETKPMPTAALAKITFKISNWTDTIKGGSLEWVITPKGRGKA